MGCCSGGGFSGGGGDLSGAVILAPDSADRNEITPTAIGFSQLVLRNIAGQTAPQMRGLDSGGGPIWNISEDGDFTSNGDINVPNVTATNQLNAVNSAAAQVQIVAGALGNAWVNWARGPGSFSVGYTGSGFQFFAGANLTGILSLTISTIGDLTAHRPVVIEDDLSLSGVSVERLLQTSSGGLLIAGPTYRANATGTLFSFTNSLSGQPTVQLIDNSHNSTGAHSRLVLRVAGTSAGSPYMLYTVTGGTTWYEGVDNAAADAYVIGQGSTLGASPQVTLPVSGGMLVDGGVTATQALVSGQFVEVYENAANPADPPVGKAKIFVFDNGGTPSLRVLWNNGGTVETLDVTGFA